MGIGDKIKNAAEDVAGKVKEVTGQATDDHSLEPHDLVVAKLAAFG